MLLGIFSAPICMHDLRDVSSVLELIRGFIAAGQVEGAESASRELLQTAPQEPEAWFWLGLALQASGKSAEAEQALRQAIALAPRNGAYWSQISTTVRAQARPAEAETWARQAVALEPAQAKYWMNLGAALADQQQWGKAAEAYRQAVTLSPHDAAAWQALASAAHDGGNDVEARTAYERALALSPGGDAAIGYALFLSQRGDVGRAIALLGDFLSRQPRSALAAMVLFQICMEAGDGTTAEAACRHALAINARGEVLQPLTASLHSALLFRLPFFPSYSQDEITLEVRRWGQQYAEPLAASIKPHTNDRSPTRRLRLGYVSPNFWNHCQSLFMTPLLAAHDRSQFDIFCYSDVLEPDHITARQQAEPVTWRNILRLNDQQVAELIRDDQIDIFVDLTVHMERNRLLVFARKPAPVQVTWLAYPGTTGVSAIDYRITDPQLDPLGLFDDLYCERSYRLPETFWCYDPLTAEPAVNTLPALKNGFTTFGCFNQFAKVNADALRLWAAVLKSVPQSRLMILAPEGTAREATLSFLEEQGVAPERVTFVTVRPRLDYLALYHRIDIALDTFPYNGHTTSLDAYWMGVPVVTLVGQTVVGRAGLSQLTNLGLTELVAETHEQYVQVAAQLAGDLSGLSNLRATLRQRMQQSPLMDAPRFARNIESAYREMWRRWCDCMQH
jgi:protein O-GlcNAc transferase